MTRFEKTVKGLEICKWEYEEYDGYWPKDDYNHPKGHFYEKVCVECPYYDKNKTCDECLEEMHGDALELLKKAGCFAEGGDQYFACGRKVNGDDEV